MSKKELYKNIQIFKKITWQRIFLVFVTFWPTYQDITIKIGACESYGPTESRNVVFIWPPCITIGVNQSWFLVIKHNCTKISSKWCTKWQIVITSRLMPCKCYTFMERYDLDTIFDTKIWQGCLSFQWLCNIVVSGIIWLSL